MPNKAIQRIGHKAGLSLIFVLGSRRINEMKVFRVLVLGEHFKMNVSGEQCWMGFYSTRFIKAANPHEARSSAIAAVRLDTKLDGLALNGVDDPPLLFVDEIEEVSELDVPEVEPGFVLFKDETISPESEISPPPYLVIRKGVAFWVKNRTLSEWTATPQAFDEGCFRNACIYDTSGSLRDIVRSAFTKPPTFVNRLMRWRQLPVRIEIRPCEKTTVADILAELAAILDSANSFFEHLDHDPADILKRLESATTPTELIELVGKYK